MYYLARGCNIRGGKLNLTVAASNSRNADGSRYWYKITYKKDAPLKEALRSFFVDVLCGNIHFYKSSRLKAAKIAQEMGALYRQYTPNITLDKDFTLGFDYVNQSHEILAESYGVPMMLGENPDDVVVKLQKVNNEAKVKYREKLDRFAADHIVLMQYASRISEYPEYCAFTGNYLDPHFANTPLIGLLANYDSRGKYNNCDNSLIPVPAGRKPEEVAPTIYALTAAIDAKDHYTFNHSRNVAVYAMTLSRHLNLSAEHQELIYEAGLLHDIGKIAIPERILGKPGKLDDEEYETMKSHVNHSIEIIRHLPNLDYLIPSVVGHHERWDGKGYPNGLAGTDIPVGARCLAIADAFDAMTSKRSYKDALSVEYAAGEILRNAGTQFDPDMARRFVALINEGVIYLEMDDVIQ